MCVHCIVYANRRLSPVTFLDSNSRSKILLFLQQVMQQIRSGGISVMAAMTSSATMGSEGEIYAGLAKALDVSRVHACTQ